MAELVLIPTYLSSVTPGRPVRTEYSLPTKVWALEGVLAEIASFSIRYEPEIVFKDGKPRTSVKQVFGTERLSEVYDYWIIVGFENRPNLSINTGFCLRLQIGQHPPNFSSLYLIGFVKAIIIAASSHTFVSKWPVGPWSHIASKRGFFAGLFLVGKKPEREPKVMLTSRYGFESCSLYMGSFFIHKPESLGELSREFIHPFEFG